MENIHRFKVFGASILTELYKNFPIPVSITPRVAGLTEIEYGEYDPISESSPTSGARDPETDLFEAVLGWLSRSGVIELVRSPVGTPQYTLGAPGYFAMLERSNYNSRIQHLGDILLSADSAQSEDALVSAFSKVLELTLRK
ncbi:hypothetical protein NJC38_02690 [Pseudomonas sp. 21LCFQ010]|uniref:hypothetical protein n=1 Tax=Pseudomonas sp. 21LCFQ010 TaxID=2957506 RepID=UPI002097C80E|nr:hypothetical protein [Pseudomonas sp. 21LCFQ010]MCO8161058.1 hypothetical protein [Pseudomonas sp. 21LCFQ010]